MTLAEAVADVHVPYVPLFVYVSDHVALVSARYGNMLINRNDVYIGSAFETYGEFSELEARCLQQFIRPGDYVIDVGANIGAHTVMFSMAVGPNGHVDAYEPQPALYSLLCAQIALNNLTNVTAYEQAASAAHGHPLWCPKVDYFVRGNFGSLSMVQTKVPAGASLVPVTTLDRNRDSKTVALIKIDVEGMELDVLRGAKSLIERDSPVLYVENDRREKSQALVQHILDLGYRIWWHLPPLFNPNNYFGDPKNIYPGIVSANMICLRNREMEFENLLEIKSADDPHPLSRH